MNERDTATAIAMRIDEIRHAVRELRRVHKAREHRVTASPSLCVECGYFKWLEEQGL